MAGNDRFFSLLDQYTPVAGGGGSIPGIGMADWFTQPAFAPSGLLSDQNSPIPRRRSPNRLEMIGNALSGAAQGYMSGLQKGAVPGTQYGLAALGAGQALSNMKNQESDLDRQQIMDLIAWKNATKNTAVTQHILPPGAILTDDAGKEIANNPKAPGEPKAPTGDMALIEMLAGGDEAKKMQLAGQLFADKTRPPQPNNPPQGKYITTPDKKVLYFPPDGGPGIPVYEPPAAGAEPRELKPTEIKEKAATEDILSQGNNVLGNLERLGQINDAAGAGPLNPWTKYVDYFVNPDRYNATQELDNLVSRNAMGELKAAFGSNPTEGERAIMLDVQGASSKPKEVRAEIFKRAHDAVTARQQQKQQKLDQINSGQYGMTTVPGAPPAQAMPPANAMQTPAPAQSAAPPQVRLRFDPTTNTLVPIQ